MADRRPQRLAAVVDAIGEAHLDGLLITGLPNIRYLTGFSGSSAIAFVTPRELILITDFRYQTQVVDEVGDFARITIESQSLWGRLWSLLAQIKALDVVGFESSHLLHRDFQRLLESGSRWQWRPTSEIVEGGREQKDPDEVQLIQQAADVAVSALQAVLPLVRTGMTENAVAGSLEKALRDSGSEGFPFATIAASGPRSALPHARSSSRRLEAGDFLLLDFGAEVDGYCADITRTVVVGKASEEQRRVYSVVQEANRLAVAGVRAGMAARDADSIARSYIEREGLGEGFGHGLGHGIGLEVHEAPRLSRTADGILAENAVVTIEPGVYRPGWGGVRIEDDVHLAAGGPRVLTRFPRDLVELA